MKLKLILTLLCAMLSFATRNAFADDPDPKFYVFLCFGQSNMEGYPTPIQDEDKKVDKRFQMLAAVDFTNMGRKEGEWYDAIPPLCRSNTGLCPVDYFGRTLVANMPQDIKVGVVNVAVAGCKIELFDKDNFKTYASTAPSWMTNIIKIYDGNPYQSLVNMGKVAQKKGVIKGILLHQGESNTGDKEWDNKVNKIYQDLLKDLDLKAENVPLLAGEVVNADQRGASAGANALIDALPKTIPTAHVISSKGCECRQQDHLHFTPAGYRELGKRYGETMLPLLGYKVPETKPAETQAETH